MTYTLKVRRSLKMLLVVGLIPIGIIINAALSYVGQPAIYHAEAHTEPKEKVVLVVPETQEQKIVRLVRETFGEDADTMLKVMKCESGLLPHAWNGKSMDGGLFQINLPIHGARLAKLGLNPYDIEDSIVFAKMLFDESGWKPWSASSRCSGAH